jgi:hydrogenase nickel incorporation protein HypA/HybF
MHELAVTQQLLQLALKEAAAAGAARVTALNVGIGELSTFSDDAVGFCWEHVARETACEGATIHFNRVAAQLTCRDCGRVHSWQGEPAPCPHCSSLRLEISAGDDLVLESIEVETEPATHG